MFAEILRQQNIYLSSPGISRRNMNNVMVYDFLSLSLHLSQELFLLVLDLLFPGFGGQFLGVHRFLVTFFSDLASLTGLARMAVWAFLYIPSMPSGLIPSLMYLENCFLYASSSSSMRWVM